MPAFMAALLGALVSAVGTLVGRVLVSLGLGYVAYQGIDTSITWARDFAISKFAALNGNALAIASTLQLGTVISILSSALLARMVLQGLTGGTIKRLVQR